MMIKFISGLAKRAIWIFRMNRVPGVGCVDPEHMTKGPVAARLKMEEVTDSVFVCSISEGISGYRYGVSTLLKL